MYKIIHSDVYSGIFHLDNCSIDLAITSPPYWGQRDYGFDGQIGNEKTYIEYISKLVKIFSILKEKMSEKGVFFLNMGDKYLSKYGKSPLGLIPYKLAFFMIENGWFLNDILIWYKPNHMPSSVKNRFTNSYEPIFVLSKNKNNYFTEFSNNNSNYSNILKINLQPSKYKHVAVYPETLVSKLIDMVMLNENNTVLDIFAGSGTTLKVVKDYNESILYNKKLNAVMIENNLNYIEIIKKRCKLENIKIINYEFKDYKYNLINEKSDINIMKIEKEIKLNNNGFFEITENSSEYYTYLSNIINKKFKDKINLNATCFLGSKDYDIELIYKTSLLNENGWVIRNLLVVEENKRWYPIFMLIDNNKKQNNIFNYKNLDLKHKTEKDNNWSKIDFIGYKVQDNLLKSKISGIILKIFEKYDNGLPKYVLVKWENNKYSKEFVINSQEDINKNINVFYDENGNISIEEKNNTIINDDFIQKDIDSYNIDFNEEIRKYNGKFREEKRINWGQSPGARASNECIYFSKQRLYEVNQNLIADFINSKRLKKGLSKKQLTDLFPKNYYHTVGHWMRKDFGGSIPLPEDWDILKKYLEIDDKWTNYVCRKALRIQTVKKGEYKLPKDFIENNLINKLEYLIK